MSDNVVWGTIFGQIAKQVCEDAVLYGVGAYSTDGRGRVARVDPRGLKDDPDTAPSDYTPPEDCA